MRSAKPSAPLYRHVVERLEHTRTAGSIRQRIGAETWAPAVEKHRPSGERLGDACEQCHEPWPCKFIRSLMRSGIVVSDPGRR